MTFQEKILFGAAVVVVAIVAVFGIAKLTTGSSSNFGAVGGMLAEHYLPFVMANGGYNSALPIATTATSTSASQVISDAAGCIQMYATSTATVENLVLAASTTAPTNGSGIIPVISYGTCP